ncbi:5-(carboxyamino)imidazole ribonucleotide synthase [Rothia dentocariosa]|uniref:5-(carboxyamino)imidazole ribonucleotide synthase n=1 Tax=Rothia dentocariosa TaxID=2047 RepID=UPI00399F3084
MTYPVTGPVLGVIGGGQLARMMAPAATNLGFDLHILAESPTVGAVAAVRSAPVGDYKDLETLREFARGKDVITFDHEHVPTEFLQALIAEGVNVQPHPDALQYAQDKLMMRQAVEDLGLPNPRWARVETLDELLAFGDEIGWPVVLKTPRGGYDGKGVMVLDSPQHAREQAAAWFDELPHRTDFSALLAEEKVPFTRELSALVARRESGQVLPWPVVETIQVNSVCDEVIAPAPSLSPAIARAASDAAVTLATDLGVTGVMAAELFEVPGSSAGFYINELAMRPHNTGHWTQEGSVTSQFEQHLRAVLDMPLGATTMRDEVAIMKNYLGGENEDIFGVYPLALSAEPRAKIHFYGKETRPGRKIGHVNITGRAAETRALRDAAANVASIVRDGRPL